MKKIKYLSVLTMATIVIFGSFSVKAEDTNALLESELMEMRGTFAKIADDAVNEDVKKCVLDESNAIIDSKEFQHKLALCIESELTPKTVKGLTDTEAQCFSLRYGLLRNVTDKCVPKY